MSDLRLPPNKISLGPYLGRPVVLNFWASWCVPCRTEMPAFAQVAGEFAQRVVFVGVDVQDTRASALNFARTARVGYPLASDPDASITARYDVVGFPTTVLIGANGRIVANHPGPLSAANLRSLIGPTVGTGQGRPAAP